MSKSKNDHGKSGGNDHDDRDNDHGSKDKGKILVGTNGDDTLAGGSRNDLIIGRAGDDRLLGGGGNDILVGDGGSGGKHWFWQHCFWWKPKGQFDDYLDGGSGSDLILAGKGDDVANYTLAENKKSHDVYDGGKGFDTLQLTLTQAEFQLASVQKDIAAFEAFLAKKANANSDDGKTFEFKSFNLDVRNFEALVILLPNRAPIAQADTAATNEDTQLIVAGPGLLANDSDPDASDVISIIGSSPLSAMGAVVFTNPDGAYIYDPSNALALQQLGQGESATDTFSYTIADLAGVTATATVSIVVTGVNDGPIAAADAYEAAEDTTLAVAGLGVLANDSDVDGDALHAILVDGPAHGTLGLNADGSFSYLPHADYFGNDSFTYRASDGMAESATRTVAIKVTDVNDAPVTAPDAVSVAEDGDASGINVLGNDSAGPANEAGQALRVTGAFADHGSVAINPDGTLNYVAGPDFFGTDTIHYTASDNGSSNGVPDHRSAPGQVTVTVTEVNDAPLAFNDFATLDEDSVDFVIDVLGNDFAGPDNESGQTLSVTSAVALNGSVLINADGTLSYTPDADFFGSDTISYTMSDDGTTNGAADPLSASAQVAVMVAPVNDAPVADDEHYVMRAGQLLTVSAAQGLLVGDTDADGDTLSLNFATVTGLQGTITDLSTNGSFAFQPDAGFTGTTSFTYTVGDGLGGFDTGLVTIEVVNSAPEADDEVYSIHAGQLLTVSAAQGLLVGDTDADGDTLSLNFATVTGLQGTITDLSTNGSFAFQPDAGFTGTTSFTYTVGDGFGGFDTALVTINVTNEAPVADDEHYVMRAGQLLTVSAAQGLLVGDTDADGDTLSLNFATVTGLQGTITDLSTNGSFAFQPDAGFTGTTSFTYTVGDGLGGFDTGLVTIEVVNSAPEADDEVYSIHAGQLLTVSAAQGLLVGDTDADGDTLSLNFATVTGLQGTITDLSTNGSFAFQPDAGFTGTTSFTYTVGDGFGGFDTALVTINVTNEAPVADDEHYVMRAGQLLTVSAAQGLLVGDTDADGDTLSLNFATVTGLQGTITDLSTNGSFAFQPDAGFTGTTSFTYTVGDGLGGFDTGLVTIEVVNSAPEADDEVYSIHAGQLLTVSAAQGLLVGDTDADGDTLSLNFATVTGLQGTITDLSTNGSFAFQPDAGFTGTTSFTYTVGDGFGGFDTALVTINVTNEAPVAVDDRIGAPIRVAVIGGALSTYAAAAAQLNQQSGSPFDLDATAIAATDFSTEAGWAGLLANYDVVVLGGSGNGNDYGDTQLFAALGDFVNAGGGVVTTGWFAQAMDGMTGATLADADAISPADAGGYGFAANLSTISFANPYHLIAGGLKDYSVQALYHELAVARDPTATTLATGNTTGVAIAYDEVGAGLTVYLGSLHFAAANYFPDLIRTGAADQIFERAVAWAAGGAATDEDTVLVIDDAQLRANDSDADGDALSISAVTAFSTLGASISIDASGNVAYNPTVALQYLDAGEVVTDSFVYTISDGYGGSDTATVTLTVEGVNDAPNAVNDSASTNEDTTISGVVLLGDTDPDGDALVVTSTGTFASALGATVSLAANGVYTYNPTASATLQALGAGASKADSFSYSISDGHGGTDTATVSITVAGLAEASSGGGNFSGPSVSPGVNVKDLSPVAFPNDGVDLYIQFQGLSNDWLRLGSFSMSLDRPVNGSGQITGNLQVKDLLATLGTGEMVVQLTKELLDGNDLDAVQIGAYAPSQVGKMQLWEAFSFNHAKITDLDTDVSADGTANALSFQFAGFAHESFEFGGSASEEGAWDIGDGSPTSTSAPSSLSSKDLGDVLATDVELQYYVRLQGSGFANDWLELGGFSMGLHVPYSGGMQSGHAQSDLLSLSLGANPMIIALTDALVDGKMINNLEIEAYAPGQTGKQQLVDQYYFEDLQVISLESTDATSNKAQFTYAAFSHGHIDQLGGGDTQFGWELGGPADEGSGGGNFSGPSVSPGVNVKDLSPVAFPNDGVDLYIQFQGLSNDWLRLGSFSMSLDRPVNGSGQITGNLQVKDLLATLGTGEMVVQLTKELLDGNDLDAVQIGAYAPSQVGKMQLWEAFSFNHAKITDLDTDVSADGTANALSFQFAGFAHESFEFGGSASEEGAWDIGDGSPTSTSAPSSLSSKDLGDVLATDVELQYYVRLQGSGFANDWLELGGFSMGLHVPYSGGMQSGHAQSDLLSLSLGANPMIIALTDALVDGKMINNLEIEAYAPGQTGKQQLVDQYYFEDLQVISLESTDATSNKAQFTYAAFSHGHIDQLGGGDTQFGWELGGPADEGSGGGNFSGPSVSPGVNVKDLSPVAFPNDGVDLYIQFQGLSNDWLRLGSFSMSLDRPVNGSGQITGNLQVKDLLATLGTGEMVVQLTKELLDGNDLDAVQIGAYAPSQVGKMQLWEAFSFNHAKITDLDTDVSADGTANALSFQFAGFAHESFEFGGSASEEGAWDIGDGSPTSTSAPSSLSSKDLGDVLATDVELQYYVRLQGSGFANDWLELGGFSMGLHVPYSGGMQSGHAQSDLLSLSLGANPMIIALTDALVDGKMINNLEIEAYAPGQTGKQQLVDQYYFEDLQVISLESTDATSNKAQFTYAAFSHGHIDQLGGGDTQFGWEFDSILV